MPVPAAASISRSFAPSPIATIRATGTPYRSASSSSVARFAAPSMIGPETFPVRRPPTTSKRFARTWSMPASAARGSITSWNPPETSAVAQPAAFARRTSSSAPGVGTSEERTSASTESSSPSSSATRARSDAAKSSSPRIAAVVISSTSARTPA